MLVVLPFQSTKVHMLYPWPTCNAMKYDWLHNQCFSLIIRLESWRVWSRALGSHCFRASYSPRTGLSILVGQAQVPWKEPRASWT